MASVQSCRRANWPYWWLDRTGNGEKHVAMGCLSGGPRSVPPDTDLAEIIFLMQEDARCQDGSPVSVARVRQANYRIRPSPSGRG